MGGKKPDREPPEEQAAPGLIKSGHLWRVTVVGEIPADYMAQGLTPQELQGLFASAVSVNGTFINSVRSLTAEIGTDGPPPKL